MNNLFMQERSYHFHQFVGNLSGASPDMNLKSSVLQMYWAYRFYLHQYLEMFFLADLESALSECKTLSNHLSAWESSHFGLPEREKKHFRKEHRPRGESSIPLLPAEYQYSCSFVLVPILCIWFPFDLIFNLAYVHIFLHLFNEVEMWAAEFVSSWANESRIVFSKATLLPSLRVAMRHVILSSFRRFNPMLQSDRQGFIISIWV